LLGSKQFYSLLGLLLRLVGLCIINSKLGSRDGI